MRALLCEDGGAIRLAEVPEPVLEDPGDVVVRVTLTTICGGDVHLRHGVIPAEMPFVSGHEYVGVVEEVGEAVRTVSPGDRVVGAAIISCGVCDRCRVGAPQGCRSGGILGAGPSWGGFGGTHAERLRVPFADVNTVRVPDSAAASRCCWSATCSAPATTAPARGRWRRARPSRSSAPARSGSARSTAYACSVPAARSPSTPSRRGGRPH
ncbi:MAG: alcohol dehydrogenase catalytic domain-containing protein [Actinobacteria bacterium]|nr:alcohol dehydrogenase catalytic domain-containing protein [Actinomycetota bacterium]